MRAREIRHSPVIATIAITGATGELGSRVARRLAEQGADQRLIVADPARAPQVAAAEIAVASSYGAEEEMGAALAGIETVYFVSGRVEPDRLDQHLALVRAAAAASVSRIVYVSFIGAAPEATFTHARQHSATEMAIRESGLAFVFLRSSLYLDLMPQLVGADGIIRGPGGNGRLAPVSRDDLADVAAAVLVGDGSEDGREIDLTGPRSFDLAGLAARLAAYAGRDLGYQEESVEEAWARHRPCGAPEWRIEGWISSYLAIADGSMDVLTDEVARLTRRPAQDLEAYLEAHPWSPPAS